MCSVEYIQLHIHVAIDLLFQIAKLQSYNLNDFSTDISDEYLIIQFSVLVLWVITEGLKHRNSIILLYWHLELSWMLFQFLSARVHVRAANTLCIASRVNETLKDKGFSTHDGLGMYLVRKALFIQQCVKKSKELFGGNFLLLI